MKGSNEKMYGKMIEDKNQLFKKKNKYIKKRIKTLLIENATLCDEVAKVQEDIQIVKDERNFLLRKLIEFENDLDISYAPTRNDSLSISNGQKTKPKKRKSLEETGKTFAS